MPTIMKLEEAGWTACWWFAIRDASKRHGKNDEIMCT
jgi:hypothetical protein